MLALILSAALGQCAAGQCQAQQLRGAVRVYSSTYTSYVEAPTVYAAPQVFAPTYVAVSPRAGFRPVRGVGRVLFAPLRAFRGGCR